MPKDSAPQDPSATSFPALLQAAYERPGALLDIQVQLQLRAALPSLPLHRGPCTARHLMLYIRSTVDNFGQVSTLPAPTSCHLSMLPKPPTKATFKPARLLFLLWAEHGAFKARFRVPLLPQLALLLSHSPGHSAPASW